MERKTRWYVDPKDSHTNKVLQRELQGAEEIHLKTNLGKAIKAYEVDYSFIRNLNSSKDDLHLNYKVFRKQSLHGVATEFDFGVLSKKRKNKSK
jgi:hypothetical protein